MPSRSSGDGASPRPAWAAWRRSSPGATFFARDDAFCFAPGPRRTQSMRKAPAPPGVNLTLSKGISILEAPNWICRILQFEGGSEERTPHQKPIRARTGLGQPWEPRIRVSVLSRIVVCWDRCHDGDLMTNPRRNLACVVSRCPSTRGRLEALDEPIAKTVFAAFDWAVQQVTRPSLTCRERG